MKKLILIFFLMFFIFFTFHFQLYSKSGSESLASLQESLESETIAQGIIENDTITRLGTNVAGTIVIKKHLAPVFEKEV